MRFQSAPLVQLLQIQTFAIKCFIYATLWNRKSRSSAPKWNTSSAGVPVLYKNKLSIKSSNLQLSSLLLPFCKVTRVWSNTGNTSFIGCKVIMCIPYRVVYIY